MNGKTIVKKLREITTNDLLQNPVWRFQGQSDETAMVAPCTTFEEPDREAYIARTRFILADNSEWWGYCSPTDDSGLDYIQPVIITNAGHVRFWLDEPPHEPEPERAFRLLGKLPDQVFPVKYECVVPFEGRYVGGLLHGIEVAEGQ